MRRSMHPALPDGFGGEWRRSFAATTAAIVGGLIAAGGSVTSSVMQSNAAKHGQDLQSQYNEEALAYQKEQDAYKRQTEANRYGAMMSGLQPYKEEGQAANTAMGSFLGLPKLPNQSSFPLGPTSGGPSNLAGLVGSGAAAGGAVGTQMVTMQAPDGTQKQVPQSEVGHWTSRGARQV